MIFSFSRLSLYEICPYRFYKKYIQGYEEPTTYPLALGKGVHKAIEDKVNRVGYSEAILNGMIEADFHSAVTLEELQPCVYTREQGQNCSLTEKEIVLPLAYNDSRNEVVEAFTKA